MRYSFLNDDSEVCDSCYRTDRFKNERLLLKQVRERESCQMNKGFLIGIVEMGLLVAYLVGHFMYVPTASIRQCFHSSSLSCVACYTQYRKQCLAILLVEKPNKHKCCFLKPLRFSDTTLI